MEIPDVLSGIFSWGKIRYLLLRFFFKYPYIYQKGTE